MMMKEADSVSETSGYNAILRRLIARGDFNAPYSSFIATCINNSAVLMY
jgi:hypothetical protein